MTHHPDRTLPWRTSTFSGSGNDCVQVAAPSRAGILVRDSKNPTGPVLTVAAAAWSSLTSAIKATGAISVP